MIRALYTAASGMNAQQSNMDTVANNLANVNTAGFKKSRMEFQDLVYQQTVTPGSPTSTSNEAPVGLEVGLGTRPISTARDFGNGNLRSTNAPLDLAIEGRGFFQISMPSGETAYTRAGSLHMSAEGALVTSEGFNVEPQITIPPNAVAISISKAGHRLGAGAGAVGGAGSRHASSSPRSRIPPDCARSAATSSRRPRPPASRRLARPVRTASGRCSRGSSRTPTCRSSRKWWP